MLANMQGCGECYIIWGEFEVKEREHIKDRVGGCIYI
jgi:hypothetical protein